MRVNGHILPDFLIVGAAKSGTTSLFHYLKSHPEIGMPDQKEPHFLALYPDQNKYIGPDPLGSAIDTLSDYRALFKHFSPDKKIGEASPSYLYKHHRTIQNIRQLYGAAYQNVKIIIMLRNPVERAWSQYWHFAKYGNEPLSFQQAINKENIKQRLENDWNFFYDYLGFGMYFNQVQDYAKTFKHVKVILFDEFKKDVRSTLLSIYTFLELADATFEPIESSIQFNPSGKPRANLYGFLWEKLYRQFPFRDKISSLFSKKFKAKFNTKLAAKALDKQKIPIASYNALRDYYREDILLLEEVIRKDISHIWT